jgi:asparagine synthetase B (glutamine-hydrolysing)
MKRFAYFGTVGKPNPAWLPSCGAAGEPSGASWSNAAERVLRLSLCCGDGIELLIRDECAVFLQGYAVGGPEELTGPDRREFLARVLDNYLHDGRFAPQQYDGSFTLVLLDGRNARVEMFRNLVGNAFSYYGKTPGGFVFGSNLADLARRSGLPLRPDAEMLPVYFIYRFVPGGNTLFEGIKRLQPGEHVSYHDGRLSARQVQTFADFDEPRKTDERESIERVEAAMAEVAGNLLAIAPEAAGLLSGGVDSTYIQAHWNRLWRATNNSGKPKSAAVWLDDPATAPDQEYALSAVRELDTDHVAVRVTGLDSRQMSATLRAVGEMPNHVQSFYFGPLAEAMLRKGISAGLCGEGADGLFGNDDAAFLQYCSGLRERVPTRALRRLGEGASRIFRHLHASRAFRLSNVLGNESDADHPLNSAAAFTDFALVAACFGRGAVAAALQHRRTLLDRYRAADDAAGIQRVLAIGYLAEAVNTAAYWNHLA